MGKEAALVLVLALALLTPGAARRKDTGPCGADKACSRKGRCVETLGDESCLCESGYAGALCEIECPGLTVDGVYCSGFGSCSKDGACRCDDGYSGQFCEVGSVMTPLARRRGRKVSPERDARQEHAGTVREEDTESRRRNLGPGAIAEEGQHARATSEESAARGGILKGSAGVGENNLGTDTLVRNHAQDREGSDTQGRKGRTSRATSDVGKGGRAEDVAQHGSAKGTRAEQRQSSRRERGNRRRAKTSAVMREWRRKADVEKQNSLEAKGEIGVRSDDEVDGGYGPLNTVDEEEKRVGEDDAGEGNRLRVPDADNKSGGLEKEEESTRAFGPSDGSYWEDAEDAAFRPTAQEENKGSAYGARGAEVRRADDGLRLGRERDSSKIEAMQEPKDVGVDRRARSQSLRTRRRDVSSAPATLRRNRGDGGKFDGEPKRWEKDGIYLGRPDGVSSSLAGGAEADLPVDDDDEGLGVGEGRVQSTEHVDAEDKDTDDSSDDRPYDVSGSRIGGRMEARDRSFSRSINLPRVSRGQSGAGGLRKDAGKGNGGRMRSREAAKGTVQGNGRLSDERSGHSLTRSSAEPGGGAALSRWDEMNVVQGKRVRGRKGPAMSRNQVRRQQDVGGQAGMDNLRNILTEMGIEVFSVLHRVCVVCADVRSGAQVGAGMRLRTVPTSTYACRWKHSRRAHAVRTHVAGSNRRGICRRRGGCQRSTK